MHKEGISSEQYFKRWLKKHKINFVHSKHPFDFLINHNFYVEVKSAKLFIKSNNKIGKWQQGRYECWSNKQLEKIKKEECIICCIINFKGYRIIQAFIRAKDYPNKRLVSMNSIQNIRKIGEKEFIRMCKK